MAIQPSHKAAPEPLGHSDEGPLERKQETSSLADVLDTVLDKGVNVAVIGSASLGGVELVCIEGSVLIASLDSYLRLADAANRCDALEERSRRPTGHGRRDPRDAPCSGHGYRREQHQR